jgi:hypothetical protein
VQGWLLKKSPKADKEDWNILPTTLQQVAWQETQKKDVWEKKKQRFVAMVLDSEESIICVAKIYRHCESHIEREQ